MWQYWVIDATLGCQDGLFCFCLIEGDITTDDWQIVTGMNYLSENPPVGAKLVAIIHADGQEAVEAFCKEYAEEIEALSDDECYN